MMYKNYIVISSNEGNEEYLRTTFHEGYSSNDYEIFDMDLISTDIGRYILDERIPKMSKVTGANIDALIYNCVTDYIDDFKQNLIDSVEEYIYSNL